ncbi:hypothetical protein CTAYLR_010753 [Chrysophaeum taylorii]|uniref:Carboxypeptidase n=1 Tax=Chrysophaeum taylorii TaxID=2483200 RepID=A0AAD7UGQ3_9STRA|nr:hypothetical protein CTAYLR_010753 [Chrysophaeum taylorii]
MVVLLWVLASGAAADDRVLSLPGAPPLPSKHYSGYINASATKHLHYYLVLSEGDPSSDPLVVWFNGGPGCSSLDGFLYEHGPFRFQTYNGTGSPQLERFEYTWAKLANVVYVEQPCGVGFSYSSAENTTSDYACTDATAAADNLAALKEFFVKYPGLKGHELYVTGESYAGVYVPTLAQAIIEDGTLALAGIAVGNGCSGNEVGICAFGDSTQGSYYVTKYLMQTAFVPNSLKNDLDATCNWAEWSQGGEIADECQTHVDTLDKLTSKLDTYCVYCDCGEQFSANSREQMRGRRRRVGKALGDDEEPTTACIDSVAASAWLNQADVQEAIHVTPAGVSDWSVCGTPSNWEYTSTAANLPRDTYPYLVDHIKVLVYNGDWDSCVPYTDAEGWVLSLPYNISAPWHPWLLETNGYQSVGGYATKLDVPKWFTFTTVRGGRHEVPETAPQRAFAMMHKFLSGADF